MSLCRFSFFTLPFIFLLVSGGALCVANTVQVSPTVTLEGGNTVTEGMVVVVNEENDIYQVSSVLAQESVFGVTAARPALVFSTGADQVPVVTEGVALVQVDGRNGGIQRGDVLITSAIEGFATRAGEFDENVFAIALESFEESETQEFGVIYAEIGADRALEVLSALRQNETGETDTKKGLFSVVRASIAAVIVVGALFFVLYSFRSTIAQGVISVGRNPRARRSIVALAFGNIVFALILFVVVVFTAIAILILPLPL